MKMECPHCQKEGLFEAVEPVTIYPTVSRWGISDPCWAINSSEFVCLECDKWVKIDFRTKLMTALESEAVYDDRIEAILIKAKAHRNDLVPAEVLEHLRKCRYRRLGKQIVTGKDVVAVILEQRP